MAHPASKKAKKNAVNKAPKRVKYLSTKEKIDVALKSARAEVDRQQENLRAARNTLRTRRIEAEKKGTRGTKTLVEKAYTAVARNVVSLDQLQRKASLAKAKVKIAQILQQAESAELKAEEKILALEMKLTRQAEDQLKITLEKFEARWRNKRTLSDARKLKMAKRKVLSKGKTLAKKAQAEVRIVERKITKATAKPVASPGRPGRPRKEDVGDKVSVASASAKSSAKTTTKKQGRPPKSATKVGAAAAPKRRGRPTKAKVSGAAKTSAAKTSELKKSALKASAKTKTASKTKAVSKVKAASKTKATAKKRGRPAKAVSKAATLKRRGRPPKAK